MPKLFYDFVQEGVNIPLTKIAAGYSPVGMVGHKILVVVKHITSGGKVPLFGKDAMKRRNTKRAKGARSNRMRREPGTWKPFHCDEYDLIEPIDKSDLDELARLPVPDKHLFSLQNIARQTVQWNLALEDEAEAAEIVQNIGSYPENNRIVLSGTDQWSDYENSKPIRNLEDGKEVV
ncbi:MAG: hypothetical protein GY749_46100 [Desulfobacteraceae bacterium]|nr:hypothetical protein [Desulfobacteraceae bacterium]